MPWETIDIVNSRKNESNRLDNLPAFSACVLYMKGGTHEAELSWQGRRRRNKVSLCDTERVRACRLTTVECSLRCLPAAPLCCCGRRVASCCTRRGRQRVPFAACAHVLVSVGGLRLAHSLFTSRLIVGCRVVGMPGRGSTQPPSDAPLLVRSRQLQLVCPAGSQALLRRTS